MNEHEPKINQISISFLAATMMGFGAFAAGFSKSGLYGGVGAFLSGWIAAIGALFLYASFLEKQSNTWLLSLVGLLFFLTGSWFLVSTLYGN